MGAGTMNVIGRAKDCGEIINQSVSKLLRSSGMSAIGIEKVRNLVFSVPFDNCLVEEGCVPVTSNSPLLLSSLDMVGLLLSEQVLMLLVELMLQGEVLMRGGKELLIMELVFNLSKKVVVFRFLSPPFLEISSKVLSFLSEVTSRGAKPTLLRNLMIFLFQQPPVLKTKRFISARRSRV